MVIWNKRTTLIPTKYWGPAHYPAHKIVIEWKDIFCLF